MKEKIMEFFAVPTYKKVLLIGFALLLFGGLVLDKWFTMTGEMIFWTCSTIVQAFAALLAFVGMFYIFQKEASMREILYSAEAHNAFISKLPLARYDRYVIDVSNLSDIEKVREESDKLNELSNELEKDEGLDLLTHRKVFDYRLLIERMNFENKIRRYESIKQYVAPSLGLMLFVLLFSLLMLPFGSISVNNIYLKYLLTSSTAWAGISVIVGISLWAVFCMVIAIRDLAFR